MGGSISCDSVLNQGTTFTVVLPLTVCEAFSDELNDGSGQDDFSVKLRGKRVLLVEDNEPFRLDV